MAATNVDQVDAEDDLANFTAADRDAFFRSYLEAALASGPEDEDGHQFDARFGIADVAPGSYARMATDCRLFMDACRSELLYAEEVEDEYFGLRREGTYAQAGYDFWMTRTGSGVGFWEDGDWPPEVAGILDAASRVFGECSVFDDSECVAFEGPTVRAESLAAAVAAARLNPPPARDHDPFAATEPEEETDEEETPCERTGPIRLDEMREAVALGANYMDNNHPGWASRIDLVRLNMEMGTRDIGGQLSLYFVPSEHIRYGFFLRMREFDAVDPVIDNYDVLTLLWKVEIQARLLLIPRATAPIAASVASVFAGPRRLSRTVND